MKKVIMLYVAGLVLLLPAYLFASSCESAVGAEYYINFTLDGVEYSCTFGFTDVGNGNPWTAVLPGGWTFAAGTNVEVSTDDDIPDDWVYIEVWVYGTTVGTYSYPAEELALFIEIDTEGVYSEYEANSGSLQITAFGDVGGAVEGRFNVGLDLVYFKGGVVPLGTAHSVEGTFHVERIEWTFPFF